MTSQTGAKQRTDVLASASRVVVKVGSSSIATVTVETSRKTRAPSSETFTDAITSPLVGLINDS